MRKITINKFELKNEFIKRNIIAIVIILLFACFYIYTLYPGIGGRINYGDSAKWQFLWVIGGTPHSTGFPLFLMLTKAFGETLFFIDPPYRITLISLTFALGCLVFTYLISLQLIGNRIAQIIPVLLLGSSVTFWSQATEAEVYTLNSFFVALIAYFFIRYHKTERTNYFLYGVFFYAISFGNHLTMITLLPALFFITLKTNPKNLINSKIILATLLFIIIGASQYFYLLYLSHQGSPYLEYIGKNASLKRWLSYITGGQFSSRIGAKDINNVISQSLPNYLLHARVNISIIGIILGLHSILFTLYRPKGTSRHIDSVRNSIVFLALILLFQLVYVFTYEIADIEVYFIPSYLIFALLIGYSLTTFDNICLKIIFTGTFLLITVSNTFNNIDRMKVKVNPLQQELSQVFEHLPADAVIYGTYAYHVVEAINYFRFVEYPHKKISIQTTMPNNGAFYFLDSSFLKEIQSSNTFNIFHIRIPGSLIFKAIPKNS